MSSGDFRKAIPLPKGWPKHVQTAILHVIALARLAIVHSRSRVANSRITRVRLLGQLEQAENEISLLKEEMRMKDARMGRLDPRRRPHYRPVDRMAILELKAARGWSGADTARAMLLLPATIASWLKRLDEDGPSALTKTREPVNRFPDFVTHIVQRLKTLCPTMGKKRISETLARAGLHLATTTVKRMLDRGRNKPPPMAASDSDDGVVGMRPKGKPVIANYKNHVWQVDLTVVSTSGFWVPWLPFAFPQAWPFCWWVACVIDQYSRRVMGFAVFAKQPTSNEVRSFLGRAIAKNDASPRYIISDLGSQFDCPGYRAWCERKDIIPRYASKDSIRATAIIERFFL
ncbi:MAG: transposase, partial [bacterium]|nr:transposase [bacterium]